MEAKEWKRDYLKPLFDPTLQEAKVLTDVWRREYNQVRPHSSLGYKTPAPETIPGSLSATTS
jgi:putative transposase